MSQHPTILMNKAIAYKEGFNQYKMCFKLYKEAESMWSQWNESKDYDMPLSNVYYNLGCLYNEHNLIPKALQYFDQSLQLNHTQLPALYELSRILLISHNFE